MPETARTAFRGELARLEEQALGAIDIVVTSLERAIEAVNHQDVELAQMVIADDDRVDGRFLEVHQSILSLLALQAPVAGDLRLIAAVLHVIKHVERMGDQCVNIAKLVPLVGHDPPTDDAMLEMICKMGALAGSQARQCKQAFALRDVPLAEDLVRQDAEINRLNRAVFRRAVEIGDDADTPRMGDDDDAHGPRAGAAGRQRGGHRRAGRLRGDRAVPGVLGRVAPALSARRLVNSL